VASGGNNDFSTNQIGLSTDTSASPILPEGELQMLVMSMNRNAEEALVRLSARLWNLARLRKAGRQPFRPAS
jgi:hypothetical protein